MVPPSPMVAEKLDVFSLYSCDFAKYKLSLKKWSTMASVKVIRLNKRIRFVRVATNSFFLLLDLGNVQQKQKKLFHHFLLLRDTNLIPSFSLFSWCNLSPNLSE